MKGGFRTLEKLAYLTGLPVLLGYAGYTLYKNSLLLEEERKEQLRELEDKYLVKHKDSLVKLENFRKKIFTVGVLDPQLNGK